MGKKIFKAGPLAKAFGMDFVEQQEAAEKQAKQAEADAAQKVDGSTAPAAVSDETEAARESLRRRQLASAGLMGTIKTGAGGLYGSANTGKSLLGS